MQNGPLGFAVFDRPTTIEPEVYGPLAEYRTCDLSDAANKSHTMSGIRPAYAGIPRLVGPAITVSLPGSGFQMIGAAMQSATPGDVLVISTHGSSEAAYWGGYMTGLALQVGLAGVVVDGALRDAEEIREHGFAAFSRAHATRVAVNAGSWGEVNVPVSCGGIAVLAGDIIVADDDGVVAIPPAWVQRVLLDVESLVHSDVDFPALTEIEEALVKDGMLRLPALSSPTVGTVGGPDFQGAAGTGPSSAPA